MSKTIFIAFAIEDEKMRDLFTGQRLNAKSPFEYVDMSVKEAYDSDWQSKVRTRIRRSHGVIALISKSSTASTGQKWEVACAVAEGKPVIGIHLYKDDPTTLPGVKIIPWSWQGIADFIDSV